MATMGPRMEKYDIVIVGAGPVGLLLSTCLARWGYKIKHIDMRPEPTVTGRADGIQPRSLDLLRNMGLKRAIMANSPAKVFEVAFWDPRQNGSGIHRTGTWPSCPSFIDARYPFTTLLHQGLIERVFIADLAKNNVQIQRPWRIIGFDNDGQDEEYPVEVALGTRGRPRVAHCPHEVPVQRRGCTQLRPGAAGGQNHAQGPHCSRMGCHGRCSSHQLPRYQSKTLLSSLNTTRY